MWRDLKYFLAYLIPFSAYWGVYAGGHWSYSAVWLAFVIIPLLEWILPQSTANVPPAEETTRSKRLLFDWLLYLNIPIVWGLIFYYAHVLCAVPVTGWETLGMTLSVGLVGGSSGVNVGHELGHRQNRVEQFLAKTLLLPALYLHFFIEHNKGHHKHVATDADPASARAGENLYAFWIRSVTGSYVNAWRLERVRIGREDKKVWSLRNEMIRFQIVQAIYLLGMGLIFGWQVLPYLAGIATVAFLLLETINYIEHYGLRRRMLANCRYEPVSPIHSWNSDHEIGRIMLYELTRHSDHHYKATRKYQILRHFEESPQLPMGYPAAVLLALAPPLWFRVMNPRLKKWR